MIDIKRILEKNENNNKDDHVALVANKLFKKKYEKYGRDMCLIRSTTTRRRALPDR